MIIIMIINNNNNNNDDNDNNDNDWFLYIALFQTQSALQYITRGHWIQYQSCTPSAPSQLPGEHSGQVYVQYV